MDVEQAKKYVKKAENKFFQWEEKVSLGERYYGNDTDIKRKGAAAIDAINGYLQNIGENPLRSADNRISENWFELLVTQKTAYMYTYPPIFTVGEAGKENDLSSKVAAVLGDDYKKKIAGIATAASTAGTAWLHYWWNDRDKKFQMAAMSADSCIGFYDSGYLVSPMIALVRRYKLENEDGKEEVHYEVWDEKETVYLQGDKLTEEPIGAKGNLSPVQKHDFGKIPFIEFANNSRKSSDLIKVKGLIDEHEKVVSGFANDLDDIQEIIWILKNYAGEKEKTLWVKQYDEQGNVITDDDGEPILKSVSKQIDILQLMKARKLVNVDENGGLEKLTNEIPYEARNIMLELLRKQIFVSGMGVDPNPEHTGQATGAYVDHLYQLLELKAGAMETEFETALKELARAILRFIGADENTKIELTWTRNKPKMDNEIVQRLADTPSNVMSDYTKRRKHPDIDDPDAEDELVEQEQKQRLKDMLDDF